MFALSLIKLNLFSSFKTLFHFFCDEEPTKGIDCHLKMKRKLLTEKKEATSESYS